MKTALVLSVVLSVLVSIIATGLPYCCSASIEEVATNTNTDTTTDTVEEKNGINIDIEAQTVNIIREAGKGCDDSIEAQGIKQGSHGAFGGGAVYTRWGRTVCPNTTGTEMAWFTKGKTSCPTSWTEEYVGYLMNERSNHNNHKHSKAFECLDKDGETFSDAILSNAVAFIDLVAAKCNVGLPCPSYVANRPITCVVCTR